ncbi:hypothetical protein HOY80DRAFT_25029 [Tuber brumale]|nr:hypothetical protein HOY80DRAFT_25029 [Tuber brumale]
MSNILSPQGTYIPVPLVVDTTSLHRSGASRGAKLSPIWNFSCHPVTPGEACTSLAGAIGNITAAWSMSGESYILSRLNDELAQYRDIDYDFNPTDPRVERMLEDFEMSEIEDWKFHTILFDNVHGCQCEVEPFDEVGLYEAGLLDSVTVSLLEGEYQGRLLDEALLEDLERYEKVEEFWMMRGFGQMNGMWDECDEEHVQVCDLCHEEHCEEQCEVCDSCQEMACSLGHVQVCSLCREEHCKEQCEACDSCQERVRHLGLARVCGWCYKEHCKEQEMARPLELEEIEVNSTFQAEHSRDIIKPVEEGRTTEPQTYEALWWKQMCKHDEDGAPRVVFWQGLPRGPNQPAEPREPTHKEMSSPMFEAMEYLEPDDNDLTSSGSECGQNSVYQELPEEDPDWVKLDEREHIAPPPSPSPIIETYFIEIPKIPESKIEQDEAWILIVPS